MFLLEPFQDVLGKKIAEIEGIFILLMTGRHTYELELREVMIPEILAGGTETVCSVLIANLTNA